MYRYARPLRVFLVLILTLGAARPLWAQNSRRPGASSIRRTRREVLRFLYRQQGIRTLSGIHNREPNRDPARWTDSVYRATGLYPALWSGDFLFELDNIANRPDLIREARREWKRGALVQLMWHSCNPALREPCGFDTSGVLSRMSDAQWQELLRPHSALHRRWLERVDEVARYLRVLQDRGVVVLFRPLHEMNQKAFWWGGRPGPQGTLALYRELHDYLQRHWGLHNLIWVWDMQDFPGFDRQLPSYDPGRRYWDVAALDYYDASGYTKEKYERFHAYVGRRLMAIGECERLPSTRDLQQQPRWSFFMSWSELTFQGNRLRAVLQLYRDPRVLTLKDMPGWKAAGSAPKTPAP